MRDTNIKKYLYWTGVVLCSLAIFFIVPLARTIREFVSSHFGREFFAYFVIGAVVIFLLAIGYVLFFRLKIRAISNYIWISVIAAIYIYFTIKLWESPEEAVHFLEYGLLGLFLFLALSSSLKDKSVYITGFLIGAMVGIFDEVIQWIVPGRYWDLRDVGLNAIACGLIQILIWKGIEPKNLSSRMTVKSFRILSVFFTINIVLIGLSFSNTPARVASYTQHFPFLSFLQKEEAMSELTYKHEDSEIGVFYSRMLLNELKETDSKKSEEYADILRYWEGKDYEDFLYTFPPYMNPFLYEFRVHVFRRNRYMERSQKASDAKDRNEYAFIAYKENLILEKYYTETLNKSPYKWSKSKIKKLEQRIDQDAFYLSPVAKGILRGIPEKYIWIGILLLLAFITGANVYLSRKKKKRLRDNNGNPK